MTIVIDSLIKLLLSVIANEKTRLIPILYQNLQRDTKPKTRGFQLHEWTLRNATRNNSP